MKCFLATLLISLAMTMGCTTRVPLDPTRPIDIGVALFGAAAYRQDGRRVSRDSIHWELSEFPDAKRDLNRANVLTSIGVFVSLLGVIAAGLGAGVDLSNSNSDGTGFVAGGSISAVLGLAIVSAGNSDFRKAVEAYNSTFEPATEPSDPTIPTNPTNPKKEIEEDNISRQFGDPEQRGQTARRPGSSLSPFYAAGKRGGMIGAHISF